MSKLRKMKLLNLSENFEIPLGENIAFDQFVFHGGEPHIKLQLSEPAAVVDDSCLISHRVRSAEDFMTLLMATDAVRRAGIKKVSLFLPYFPAARQDRVMVPGEPLSLKIYADWVNAQGYERVFVFDPHSDVTLGLLDRCSVITNHAFIKKVVQHLGQKKLVLVAPDVGAMKKVQSLSAALGGMPTVQCLKKRDVKTGNLSGFQVFTEDLKGKDCLIVDDICDGGGTFIGIAKKLREKGAGKIHLAVSHGIFSDGWAKFEDILDGLFTTDSFRNIESEKVVQFSMGNSLLEHL